MSNPYHHPEFAAFVAAMRLNPDDRVTPLVCADWLDEQPQERVVCPKCKGTRYRGKKRPEDFTKVRCECGTGTILSTANADKAEFIRVQCRIAEMEPLSAYFFTGEPERIEFDTLCTRSRALLAANETAWRAGPVCKLCKSPFGSPAHPECRRCFGTGDAGGLLREFCYATTAVRRNDDNDPVRIDWARFPALRVSVPRLGDAIEFTGEPSPISNGEWQPTDWLTAVVTHHPGVFSIFANDFDVYLSDPNQTGNGFIWRSSSLFDHDYLPDVICPKESFDTREAAVAALGRRIVAFARKPTCAQAPAAD